MKRLFFPPLSKEEYGRRLSILRWITIGQLIGLSVLTVSGALSTTGSVLLVILPCLLVAGLMWASYQIGRRGSLQWGGLLTTFAILAALAYFTAFFGARDQITFIFVWPIMVAAVLMEPAATFLVAMIAILIIGALTVLEYTQWIALPLGPDLLYTTHWHKTESFDLIQALFTDWLWMSVVLSLTALLSKMFASNLQKTITQLRRAVGNFSTITQRINSSSEEIVDIMEQVRTGASEQSVTAEEIASSMRSLTELSYEIADRSEVVARNAADALKTDNQMAERIEILSRHAQRIEEILEIMVNISNKTDILAMNAALEGVTAGARGRGFVMVAARMRHLAADTMNAVKEVRDLTKDISHASEAATNSTREARELANRNVDLTEEISLILHDQKNATEGVHESMEEILQVAKTTASSSSGVVEGTKSLGDLAESLLQLLTDPSKSVDDRSS